MSTRKISIVVCVLLAVLLGIFGTYTIMQKQQQAQQLETLGQFNRAQEIHHEGKTTESIAAHQAILAQLDIPQMMKVKSSLAIAADYFARRQPGDLEASVHIYQQMVPDETLTAFQRAATLNEMLDLYQGTHDEHIARDVIFKGAPLQQFLELANGDLDVALNHSYEYSYKLYPTPIAAFRIAEWYGKALDTKPRTSPDYDHNLSQLKEWVAKGEETMTDISKFGYEASRIGYMFQLNAMTRVTLARNTDKNFAPAEVRYKTGLAELMIGHGAHEYTMELFLRFHYAAFLSREFPETRLEDIKKILAPTYDPKSPHFGKRTYFDEFLANEVSAIHDEHLHKKDLARLSRLDPDFKIYLAGKGIHYGK